jgi:hypothetical protein
MGFVHNDATGNRNTFLLNFLWQHVARPQILFQDCSTQGNKRLPSTHNMQNPV